MALTTARGKRPSGGRLFEERAYAQDRSPGDGEKHQRDDDAANPSSTARTDDGLDALGVDNWDGSVRLHVGRLKHIARMFHVCCRSEMTGSNV